MRRQTAAISVPVIELSYADDGRRATKRSRDFPIMNKTPERKATVLITGALTGIGRATAFAFARQGARLIVSGRRDEAGHALVKELRELGTEAEYVRADVRHEKEVENLVDQAVKSFGRLDIAVNNAGTEGTPGSVIQVTPETYTATFDTNVLGVLLSVKHELRVMQAQRSGSIVNITSAFGKVGGAGAAVYIASKHAVEGITKAAAMDAAPFGVRVNAVAPGPVETDMFGRFAGNDQDVKNAIASLNILKRVAAPEEIANAIAFVGSDKASFVTGQSFSVDGGHTTG
jgi:NAD(P)-dependent dehydrogenase (short-subunit alcohol dehydrogenase family)